MNNNSNMLPDEDVIDLRDLLATLLKHWYIILACILLAFFASIFYLRSVKPVYAVDALLHVESGNKGTDALLGELSGLSSESPVQAEIEIMRSRMILGDVANKLHLDKVISPKQKSFLKNNHSEVSYTEEGVIYTNDTGSITIKEFNVAHELENKNLLIRVLSTEKYSISARNPDSGVYDEISVLDYGKMVSLDTKYGLIQINLDENSLVQNTEFYLQKLDLKLSAARISRNLIAAEKGKRTGILSVTYQGTDKKLITNTLNEVLSVYIAENISRLGAQKRQTLIFLEKQLPKLKADLNRVESKFNQFRKKNNTVDVTKESQLLLEQSIKLETKKNELKQKKAELESRFTDEYPLISQINNQIKVFEKQEKDIEKRLTDLPNIQRKYFQLFRDVEVNTQLYTNLLNSYQQLKIANAGEIGNVRLIDKAVSPVSPIKPRKKLVLLLSIVFGTLVGIVLTFIKQLFNAGVKDSSLIESALGLPILANIPRSKIQTNIFNKKKKHGHKLLALENPNDISIESLRSLRTSIHFSMMQAKNNVLLITGASPSIGKSFTTANFAIVLAKAGKKVLLIDGDMRRGHLHQYFGLANSKGLSEYLSNDISLNDVVLQSGIENVDVIWRGKSPTNPAELLMSETFDKLLSTMINEYDIVLIDSPPVLAVTDSSIIAEKAGTTLVVARYGVSKVDEIETTISRLNQNGANIKGVVFNDVQREFGSTYSYQYGYEYTSTKK